ncbi:MAG: putative inorganic carbon transporter subunit DabA, partial [Planctomycetota bacterium]
MNGAAIVTDVCAETEHAACCAPLDLNTLHRLIEHAALLLPMQGPITAFAFLNTLQALEHLPFHEGLKQGAKLYGCQPYMPEDYYRKKLMHSRKRVEELSDVLVEDLGDTADALIGFLGTRYHLRLAMLQYPMRIAPQTELEWLIAETDALRKFRFDAPGLACERTIEETRHWVMRDLRNGSSRAGTGDGQGDARDEAEIREIVQQLFEKFGKAQVESWDEETWETYTLHLLWQVCQRGVGRVLQATTSTRRWVRHRDVLLEATGQDSDRLVHEVLTRFTAAFVDQGFAGWMLPGRERGYFRA